MGYNQGNRSQSTLFSSDEVYYLTLEEAANRANVSVATIRNWVKTGYLLQTERGKIDGNSFNEFMDNIAGKEKLSSRANKLLKDFHDHKKVSDKILSRIADNFINSETVVEEYQNLLSESYRNKEGIYYTPKNIVQDMMKNITGELSSMTFCDPCCGGGNFIMNALEIGFLPENIYGFDTDPNAVAITKKRIHEKTGFKTENIINGDFLEKASKNNISFDYIYTNPPWGKKIEKNEKERYSNIFKCGRSLDTSSLFFFASLSCLNQRGEIGFLLQEAFFNIASFRDVRKKIFELSVITFSDYDKPFKGLMTKAKSVILSNLKNSDKDYLIECESKSSSFKRSAKSFVSNPKYIINMGIDEDSAEIINHVFSLPHITLENNADWGIGIVTGNNMKYCKPYSSEGHIPIFKGSDILHQRIKDASTFIPQDLSLYQQVAPRSMYEADEKIIYRFITSKLCFHNDTEKRYILNSANMLVLKKRFPIKSKQLCDILNSEFINWLFRGLFNTHKVLRGDLEVLPIHYKYFEQYDTFSESDYLQFLSIIKQEDGTYRIKE